MVVGLGAVFVEGVAGAFSAVGQDIVAAGFFRRDSQAAQGFQDHSQLPIQVIILLGHQKGKIQIPQIVKHSAAAGEPAGQMTTLLSQEGGSAFFPWVLVAADDHGVPVLPEVEDALAFLYAFQQGLLHRQIIVGVVADPFIQRDLRDHPW